MNNGILYWNKKRFEIKESPKAAQKNLVVLWLIIPIRLHDKTKVYDPDVNDAANLSARELIYTMLDDRFLKHINADFSQFKRRYNISCVISADGEWLNCGLITNKDAFAYMVWTEEVDKQNNKQDSSI